MKLIERYQGCLLGLAVGDALGVSVEFSPPGTFEPVADMTGGGCFGLKPGQWTDDTSMALCLAESLIETNQFDPGDQMQRYVRWWRKGHLSVTGKCFDIGNTTRTALAEFEKTGNPYCGSTASTSAGNGSLMRLAPIPMFFFYSPQELPAAAANSSRTTHAAPEAVDACRYYAMLIAGALAGLDKTQLLAHDITDWKHFLDKTDFQTGIQRIIAGSYKTKQPPQIKGTGYVVDCLEAALWAFYHGQTFEQGALLAINLGDDADTTAAVYGQLAGAFYGVQGIPSRWLDKLAQKDLLDNYAVRLYEQAVNKAVVYLQTNKALGSSGSDKHLLQIIKNLKDEQKTAQEGMAKLLDSEYLAIQQEIKCQNQ